MNLWRWHLAINRQGPLKEMFANLPWWNRPSLHLDRKLVLDAIDFGGIWKGALRELFQ